MKLLAAMHLVAPKSFPKSLKKASWRVQNCPKGVRGILAREPGSEPGSWGLPLTSGANPSCSADCQDERGRAPKATFSDIAKYVILQYVLWFSVPLV